MGVPCTVGPGGGRLTRWVVALAVAAFVLAAGFVAIVSSVLGGASATLNQNTTSACAPATSPGVTLSAADLTAIQLKNASTIVSVGRSIPAVGQQGLIVALATALVESNLTNWASPAVPASELLPNDGIHSPDADSIGLFQQRPSQGWGSVATIMDPASSARTFFTRLVALPTWPPPPGADAAVLGGDAQDIQRSADGDKYAGQIPVATQLVDSAAPTTTISATSGGVAAAPDGVPTPAGGWSTQFADSFEVPFSQDPLWHTDNGLGNNPAFETEVYTSSAVTAGNGNLDLTATPDGGGTTSGRVVSDWTWLPGTGSEWVFEIDARFPTGAGLFNAFWSSSVGNWSNEMDFFEGHPGNVIDSDHIFDTATHAQQYEAAALPFDPSAAFHRYTYVVYPDSSWALFIDGQRQTWAGGGAVSEVITPMELILNYATVGGGPGAPSTFDIRSVAAYQDVPHAGVGTSKAIGPGTVPGAPRPALTGCTTVMAPHITLPALPKGVKLPAAVVADIEGASPKAATAVLFALRQVGKLYQWGGTGDPSYDCSGLTQAAWGAAGVALTRTTYTQINQGTPVAEADLQPGDLVFPDPGHVSLYLGSGWIVEAPDVGQLIHVVPMWGFWQARRVVPAGTQ